jgi:hypothetical protein
LLTASAAVQPRAAAAFQPFEEGVMPRHSRRRVPPLLLWLMAHAALVSAQEAAGPPGSEVERLRGELEALREEYAQRFTELEARLLALKEPPTAPPAPPAPSAPAEPAAPLPTAVPAGAAGAGGPSGSLPVYGGAASSKVFNPDIAVIGNFLGAAGRNEVDAQPTLTLDEAEASFQAIVDPYARADFFVAFGPEGAEIEEGFASFPALPGGLLMKAGKLKNAFGKVNTLHAHALPWTDRPLVLTNLLGGDEGLADAGISLSRLLPNPWLFLEATAEVYRGESEVFASHERSDLSYLGRLRGYGDLSESSNLDLGLSFVTGHNEFGTETRTSLFGADLTFRYRPLRRAIYRRLLARAEAIWRETDLEQGRARAFGAYASAEYQFARRWFAGARYDYAERAFEPSLVDKGGSLQLTFWPSEFSQVRGQYRRTSYAEGQTAHELLFQLLFSIGAHGAHAF